MESENSNTLEPQGQMATQQDRTALPLKVVAGLLGSILLLGGTFVPFFFDPVYGNLTYLGYSSTEAVITLVLAAISLAMVLKQQYKWLWLTGLIALVLLAASFVRNSQEVASFTNSFVNDPTNPARSVPIIGMGADFLWGAYVLAAGGVLVLLAAALGDPLRLRKPRTPVETTSAGEPADVPVTAPTEPEQENIVIER